MDDKTRKLLLAVINDEIEFWKKVRHIQSLFPIQADFDIAELMEWYPNAAEIVVDYLGINQLRTDAAPDVCDDVCDGDCREQNGCRDGERCGHVDDWLMNDWLNDIGEDAEAYLDKLLEYLEYKDLLSGAKPQAIQPDSPTKSPSELE